MTLGYLTVRGRGRAEIVVKRSKFIATASPVAAEEDAQGFVDEVRREFWDATHNVYAFVVGEHNEVARSSDDGEPSGTAGRPVLEVIRREDVHYCAVVVTRYFGGTLLGAGGLIRAYSAAAREGLYAAGIARAQPMCEVRFVIEYPMLGKVQNQLAETGVETVDVDYAERVTMRVMVPSDALDLFAKTMTELLSGAFEPQVGEERLALVDP
ncbi:MAG TPA: YigZ family protein [Bacillota bacterium]|nr:YigZ family protein [Bacillota bacterium]